jgi:hypothetical protein
MSDDENFLARWSRRKRGAALDARDRRRPENAARATASEAPPAVSPSNETQPPFDLASLPTIDSIGAGSDIRGFLSAGVPAALTRAALRRAWSADPTIRDFIGLSENSWDFNAPGGVPGFGSITAEEVQRLLAKLGGEEDAADPVPPLVANLAGDDATPPARNSDPVADGSVDDLGTPNHDAGIDHVAPAVGGEASSIATQHEPGERECSPTSPRRGHGGALPR